MRFGVVSRLGRYPAAYAGVKVASCLSRFGEVSVLSVDRPERHDLPDGVGYHHHQHDFTDWVCGLDAAIWTDQPNPEAVECARTKGVATALIAGAGDDCDGDGILALFDYVFAPSHYALDAINRVVSGQSARFCAWSSPPTARGVALKPGRPTVYLPHDGQESGFDLLAHDVALGLAAERINVYVDAARWSKRAKRYLHQACRITDRITIGDRCRPPELETARHAIAVVVSPDDPYSTHIFAARAAGSVPIVCASPFSREATDQGTCGVLVPGSSGPSLYVAACVGLIDNQTRLRELSARATHGLGFRCSEWDRHWAKWAAAVADRSKPAAS